MSCVDLPQIVAKQSWLAQSSALSAVTVFTPSADGLFRVSAYIEVPSGGTIAPSATLNWTDDHSTHTGTNDGALGQANPNQTWQISGNFAIRTFRATSGNAITVSTNVSGSGTYDLYVVIEQLW